jgi:sugar lactone lactonase YvrE
MTNQFAVWVSKALFAGLSASAKGSRDRDLSSRFENSRHKIARGRGVVSFTAGLMLLVFFGVPAQAQTLLPNWYQLSPANSPSARDTLGLTFDAAHRQMVMFGGFSGSYLNDTWLWNGTNWTQANPANSPSPRSNVEMVYDPATGNVVLFGGLYNASTRYNDTWTWDGTNWTQQNPAHVPPGRASASMVYDAATGNVVMFGGLSSSSMVLNDTWTWNGSDWTQASPSTSPSARAAYGMAYDAAHSQVVLFGGTSGGSENNDTWIWDGTNWTQQSPGSSPTAREGAGMDYDPLLGQAVLFGGYDGSEYLNDTWTWDGTSWTEQSPAASPSVRYVNNGVVYDPAQGQLFLFGAYTGSNVLNDTWVFGLPQNFGSINVCPSGQSIPSPCSNTLAFIYNVATTTTFGAPKVVTQGAPGLDFALASGNTCTGTITAGNTCTVNVTFTPIAPGLRAGAVELFDNLGNLLVTSMVYGIGQGPAVAFGPGTQTALVGVDGVHAAREVALDGAGNMFIAENLNNQVVKLPAGGGAQTTVGTGLNMPYGVAMDGAGNIFIADTGNNRVVEVPAGCTNAACQTTVGTGLSSPYGLTVDGAGDLFIADSGNSRVAEVPASCTSVTCQTTVGSGLGNPLSVAVDGAGDVLVGNGSQVVEVPAGCASAACQITVASGLIEASGVTVDAAGDVFITDTFNSRVLEVPAGCTSVACQTTVGTGFVYPYGVAVDGAGDIFITDTNDGEIAEVNRSQAPSLSFATTNVGYTSTDSPQSISLQNVGNQTLNAVSPGFLVVSGSSFVNVPGSGTPPDCSGTASLVPGADCNLSIDFTPQTGGLLTSTAVFNDNALNATSAAQSIALSGFGVENFSLSVTGSGTGTGFVESDPTGLDCNELSGSTSGTCSASFLGGVGISLEEVPTAGSTFTGWTGPCAGQGQICVLTLSASTSVSATFAAAVTNYSLQLTEVGNGTGIVADNQSQISCSEANGAVAGACTGNYASGTLVTLAATPAAGSTFLGWGGACSSSGATLTCSVVVSGATNVTASFSQPNFGNVNVCPAGQTTPAPCNSNLALTFNMASTTTVGAIQVVTQGATGLDFSLGSGSTCTGTIAAGNSCTVNVNFAPIAPGWRMGAAKIFDNNGNLIATEPVYGNGQAPAIAFGPGTQITIGTGSFPLSNPRGVLVDAAGNLFISDVTNQEVVKVSPNGSVSTVGFGFQFPQGLAEDGAGDLFVADNNLNEVVEIPAGCASINCQVYLGSNLRAQLGVAADGAGDVFFDDFLDGEAVEIPAGCTSNACQKVVYAPGNGSDPVALTADAAGDLFVADFGMKMVEKVPAGCASTGCLIPIGTGWQQPDGVAVDAAGDVFVADAGLDEIVEVPAGCTSSACQVVMVSGVEYSRPRG